ncbi:uncharacterized protein [Euphorbia lathyris]|uniref:uncharacterized protein n=1 Tax=Euphorbia lathyris TaxID=212925 RepID=UPI003313A8BF
MAPPFLLHAGFPSAAVNPSATSPRFSRGKTGFISSIGNFAAPVTQWRAGGSARTSLTDLERRHGRFKPVIKKPMVELDDTYTSLLPYLSSPQQNLFSFPLQEFESEQIYSEDYNLLDGYVGNGNYSDAFMQELNSEVPFPAVVLGEGQSNESENNHVMMKKQSGGQQNIAANLLPYLSSPQHNLISFPPQEFESENRYSEDYNMSDGYIGNGNYSDAFMPELNSTVPFPAAVVLWGKNSNESENNHMMMKKQSGGGRSLSAQSIAARERRRKITEKTQELGKLIPGGNKMSTAEMLGSAFNYVKFMQAQVQLLQLMQQIRSNKDESQSNELENLVTSPKIQEKLYSEEKCLVPREFVRSIANHTEIPFLIDELRTYC